MVNALLKDIGPENTPAPAAGQFVSGSEIFVVESKVKGSPPKAFVPWMTMLVPFKLMLVMSGNWAALTVMSSMWNPFVG